MQQANQEMRYKEAYSGPQQQQQHSLQQVVQNQSSNEPVEIASSAEEVEVLQNRRSTGGSGLGLIDH